MPQRATRTDELPPGAGSEDWIAYFANYSKLRSARKGLGGYELQVDEDGMEIAVEAEEAEKEPPFVLLEAARPAEFHELPTAMRTLHNRLSGADWEVDVQRSLTDIAPVLYMSASAEDNARSYEKGDVRFAGYEAEHFGLIAVRRHDGQPALALTGVWDRPLKLTSAGAKTSAKFVFARTFVLGIGRDWYGKATPFNEWLDLVIPRPEPKKKRPAKADKEAELLAGGEWNG